MNDDELLFEKQNLFYIPVNLLKVKYCAILDNIFINIFTYIKRGKEMKK